MKFQLVEFNSNAIVTTDIEINAHNLMLRYSVAAAKDFVWPEFKALERKDELWKSTCLELFVASKDDPSYLEINLSPCGAWNSYAFASYRQGMKEAPGAELVEFDVESRGVITASFVIPEIASPILLGPAVILADNDGNFRYFSTGHGKTPDFHDRVHHVLVSPDHL